jgi:DNA-binding NtrC family response regulator
MNPLPTTPLPHSCLLVEDDPGFAEMIREVLIGERWEVVHAGTLARARAITATRTFDLVVLDNHLPDGKGFDFYFELVRPDPAQTVIVLTGLPELAQAVELTRRGLFDYLAKPVQREAFMDSLRRARARLERRRAPLRDTPLIATTPAMRAVQVALDQAAQHPSVTVLFTGETGTGKDAAARALHQRTHPRADSQHPFLPVNCAALPGDMFEAELFGAERGAYTGADRSREGLAGAARQGSLFLDEIGEVPLNQQAKLLRFLEAREYRPLGGTTSRPFEARLMAATNRSLSTEVAAGRFREDLLYRLDVFTIHLPPLRERSAEIPALAEHLLHQLADKYARTPPSLLPEDVQALLSYPFPGNVRELRNLLERSLLRTPTDAPWLALDLLWLNRSPSTPWFASTEPPVTVPAPPTPTTPRPLPTLEAGEYQSIRDALAASQGGIRRAAALLGISHQALLRRLEKWPELRKTDPPPTPP